VLFSPLLYCLIGWKNRDWVKPAVASVTFHALLAGLAFVGLGYFVFHGRIG